MALWGGRFGEETQNDVKIYSESISFDQRLYKHDIAGSKAHVAMLAKQGIIPAASAEAIRNELDKVCERIEKGDFSYDIAKEDIHMHVESALIDVLGAEGARVHSGRVPPPGSPSKTATGKSAGKSYFNASATCREITAPHRILRKNPPNTRASSSRS